MSAATSSTVVDPGTSPPPRVPPTLARGVAIALLYAVPFLWGAMGMSIALAIVVFRRGRDRDTA